MSGENRIGFTKPPGTASKVQQDRANDLKMLGCLLETHEGLSAEDRAAFVLFRAGLEKYACLTVPLRRWVRRAYEELVKKGIILPALGAPPPRGKEVQSMVGHLAKRPPGRT